MASRSRKKLSTLEADTLTSLNQQQSPLLRLPGEIRNKIYAYLFGGLIIESKPTAVTQYHGMITGDHANQLDSSWGLHDIPAPGSQIPVHARQSDSPKNAGTISATIKLLMVCRQVHAETRLLPFQMNEFQIRSKDLKYFLNRLSNAQRDSISTFRLKQEKAAVDGFSWSWMLMSWESVNTNVDMHWLGFLALVRMRGLKRVVVEDWSNLIAQRPGQPGRDSIVARVIQCVGDRGIEIIFEKQVVS